MDSQKTDVRAVLSLHQAGEELESILSGLNHCASAPGSRIGAAEARQRKRWPALSSSFGVGFCQVKVGRWGTFASQGLCCVLQSLSCLSMATTLAAAPCGKFHGQFCRATDVSRFEQDMRIK